MEEASKKEEKAPIMCVRARDAEERGKEKERSDQSASDVGRGR